MPYKDKEQKKSYDRERLRRIREKQIEKEVDSGNLNFKLDKDVKPSNEDLKPEKLGANFYGSENEIIEPKKRTVQEKLREIFPDKSE